jgi:glycosyltransferase involved in cell wall biosynthesis
MTPKVSIIIPTYNQEKYIEQTILSALNQIYSNLEIIISDDNSIDNTYKKIEYLINKYNNIKYFKNTQNLGRVKNYHKALYEYATGELALNLDGDDYLTDNEYINEAVTLFVQNPDIILVYAKHGVLIDDKQKIIHDKKKHKKKLKNDGNSVFMSFQKGSHIDHLTSLYDRKYAMKIGYYTQDIMSSDWESVLRLIINKKVGFINKEVGIWRKHSNNASKSIQIESIMNNTIFIENAFHSALYNQITSHKKLLKWRKKMLIRMFYNFIIKILYIKPENLSILLKSIKLFDKKIYYKIRFDLKFHILHKFSKNKKIMYLVFKYILKKESFISDLI